ncbi:3-dehydroquinate synthase family protein, partial [Candidatus Protofrankia californiensis]|uniref:3-dehydroquinate synthase family protein n=1 Tax=Candidatus Protofrankia californiensis TaxID=1839754 RepID=UPI0019D17852
PDPTTPQPEVVNFRAARELRWTAIILPDLLDFRSSDDPDLFGSRKRSRRRFVVIDQTVYVLYGHRILALLKRYGIEHNTPFLIPGGEASKTEHTVARICAAMDEWGVQRFDEPMLIFGGGSVLDTAGEAANRYRRGIERRNYGTTLVAMIDVMFAIKTAVNHGYKNRVGSYHPPAAAYGLSQCLGTLTREQVLDGVGEIYKVGLMLDGEVFGLLEDPGPRLIVEHFQGQDPDTLAVLARTLQAMSKELSNNPFEDNPARASYGGHGISPGMEPEVTHGEAVVLDLLWTTMLSWRRGYLETPHRDRIVALARLLGLPLWHPVLEHPERLTRALADTARHRGGRQLIPAPVSSEGEYRPGKIAYLDGITDAELQRALADLRAIAGA